MNYEIVRHQGGRKFIPVLAEETNEPLIYDNAKRAAEMAKAMSEILGVKCQPRPVTAKNDWRERERQRFAKGEYKPVLWVNEPWWQEVPDHFVHIAVNDKTRIAYTPDAEKGAADRQTSTLPGKYLTQFFGKV